MILMANDKSTTRMVWANENITDCWLMRLVTVGAEAEAWMRMQTDHKSLRRHSATVRPLTRVVIYGFVRARIDKWPRRTVDYWKQERDEIRQKV